MFDKMITKRITYERLFLQKYGAPFIEYNSVNNVPLHKDPNETTLWIYLYIQFYGLKNKQSTSWLLEYKFQ